MVYADNPLFYSSLLLFSDESMEKLTNGRVAVAGIGGVGSVLVEMLVRNGIGNLKIADIEPYEDKNLNRQLFATIDTIGVNKAVAGADRLKKINPNCNIKVYENGVNLENVNEFCSDVDVVVVQTDTESSKILMHRTSKEYRIPVVCGSRGSIRGHRWNVKAKVWNYRDNPDLPCYDVTNHPDIAAISTEKLNAQILKDYDDMIKLNKMNIFNEFAVLKPEMFGSISQKELNDRIGSCDNYYNRHVCSVLANTAGCLAAAATLKLILGGPDCDLELNLWEGNQDQNSSDHKSDQYITTNNS